MEYFFDKSLRTFSNKQKTIKIFLSSSHITVCDNNNDIIRMPNRIKRPIKGQRPPIWRYDITNVGEIIVLKLLFDGKVHTTIQMNDKILNILYSDIDNIKGKSFEWNHEIGKPFNTTTNYI